MQYPVNNMATGDFGTWFRRQLKRRGWTQADFNRPARGAPLTGLGAGRSIGRLALVCAGVGITLHDDVLQVSDRSGRICQALTLGHCASSAGGHSVACAATEGPRRSCRCPTAERERRDVHLWPGTSDHIRCARRGVPALGGSDAFVQLGGSEKRRRRPGCPSRRRRLPILVHQSAAITHKGSEVTGADGPHSAPCVGSRNPAPFSETAPTLHRWR